MKQLNPSLCLLAMMALAGCSTSTPTPVNLPGVTLSGYGVTAAVPPSVIVIPASNKPTVVTAPVTVPASTTPTVVSVTAKAVPGPTP